MNQTKVYLFQIMKDSLRFNSIIVILFCKKINHRNQKSFKFHRLLHSCFKIQTNEMLFRWGFVADLINFVVGIPTILIIYHFFKKSNKKGFKFVKKKSYSISVNDECIGLFDLIDFSISSSRRSKCLT